MTRLRAWTKSIYIIYIYDYTLYNHEAPRHHTYGSVAHHLVRRAQVNATPDRVWDEALHVHVHVHNARHSAVYASYRAVHNARHSAVHNARHSAVYASLTSAKSRCWSAAAPATRNLSCSWGVKAHRVLESTACARCRPGHVYRPLALNIYAQPRSCTQMQFTCGGCLRCIALRLLTGLLPHALRLFTLARRRRRRTPRLLLARLHLEAAPARDVHRGAVH